MSTDSLHDIVHRLGGQVSCGGLRASVPGPGHSRRDRSLSLLLTPQGRVVWKSFAGDGDEAVREHLGLGEGRATPRDRRAWDAAQRERRVLEAQAARRRLVFCARVWGEAGPAAGSPVAAYLASRGLASDLPPVLRFHPAAPMDYRAATRRPAMLALVQDAAGAPIGLHLTALRPDGSAKAGPGCRRMFGQVAGGAVRLSEPAADGTLAVAEGIETALAFGLLHRVPAWAALSAAGLSRFDPPLSVRRLIIAADRDDGGAGLGAAHDLQRRLTRRCATALAPAPEGMDWADVLAASSRAASSTTASPSTASSPTASSRDLFPGSIPPPLESIRRDMGLRPTPGSLPADKWIPGTSPGMTEQMGRRLPTTTPQPDPADEA